MISGRAGGSAVAGTLAAVLLALVVVLLAARTGPSGIMHGTGHDGVYHAPVTTAPASVQAQPGPPGGLGRGATPWWVRVILFGLLGVSCLLLLFAARGVIGLIAGPLLHRRRRGSEDPRPGDVGWLDDPGAVAEELRRGSDLREQLLRTGTPRNAIVACWDRFEEQAEAMSLAREAWETSSEFTVRLLGTLAADLRAVDRLAGLFCEARFSDHEITEQHRERAIQALRAVHGSLRPLPDGGADPAHEGSTSDP
jgi:hypothetical protein